MEIIPAIDLIDGKCVRLTQGDFQQVKVYNENPLEVAKQFEGIGITHIHLVDLDGAKSGSIVNLKTLESIASNTNLTIDFGGGINTNESIYSVFEAGASIATIGSLAVKDKLKFFSWVKKYGPNNILLGADVKNEKITIGGWLSETEIDIFDFVEENMLNGVENIFCTDVSKDGMLEGPSFRLYQNLLQKFEDINLIASGGVTDIEDLKILESIGCSGVIIGKAIYENRISLNQLEMFIGK